MFSISIQVYIGIIQGTIHCYYNEQPETEEKEPWNNLWVLNW